MDPFEGKWQVVDERVRGKGRNSPATSERLQLKAVVFRDDSLLIEQEIDGKSEVIICRQLGHDSDVVIFYELPYDIFEKQLHILKGLFQSDNPDQAEFRIEKYDLELKSEPSPDHQVRYELRLQRGDSRLSRALTAGPDSGVVLKAPGPAVALSARKRASREVRQRNRAVSLDPLATKSAKTGDDTFVFEIAQVGGLVLDQGQQASVISPDVPAASAVAGQMALSGADVTAKVREEPAPTTAKIVTIAKFRNRLRGMSM